MASCSREVSYLCEFGCSIRELCPLGEDTLLCCVEGETDVYEWKVSTESYEGESTRTGKVFCKVPYFGTPLVLHSDQVGRFVVVVPTGDTEQTQEWVVALDSVSHSLGHSCVPSPVKYLAWNDVAVFKNAVHILYSDKIVLIPVEKLIPSEWRVGTVSSERALDCPASHKNAPSSCCCFHLAVDTPIPIQFDGYSQKRNRLFATTSLLGSYDLGYDSTNLYTYSSANEFRQKPPPFCRSFSSAVTSVCGGIEEAFVGTETGTLHRVGFVPRFCGTQPVGLSPQVDGQEFQSEDRTKIGCIAVMPKGDLLLSQGSRLMIVQDVCSVLPSMFEGAFTPTTPMWRWYRHMVLQGGGGGDVALSAKDDQEGRKVFGMKELLSRRCEFFKVLFSERFKEGKESVLQIGDTSFEALRAVVLYLHTGLVDLQEHFALQVAELARRFQLNWLQRTAETFVKDRISEGSWMPTLLFAEQQNFPDLRELSINFAAKNFQKVWVREEFEELRPTTLCDVLELVAGTIEKRS
uniref:BTB domain-containing protein n=1 Tax=Chromera velia CCMP2878 TaxID=1169474 RepID=A0A0G4I8A3_9ALVE|eukprot:Cvel_11887.t1-p1 / transcript=Cvel_11887.t1 / gene=Cvel_11887 / organism=Chromera_velia_CCMP2878 / gene_product=BTB/POZ domain-containing protein At4g08455, putative / transcript_product=BTB/POZ domain-containing protein At4g08455, putative / location=Cvel_scaffold760:6643-8441(-) / protein_length=519 / sequence_SO=supercontig / SO=protein_coding / is_pseudo=false